MPRRARATRCPFNASSSKPWTECWRPRTVPSAIGILWLRPLSVAHSMDALDHVGVLAHHLVDNLPGLRHLVHRADDLSDEVSRKRSSRRPHSSELRRFRKRGLRQKTLEWRRAP